MFRRRRTGRLRLSVAVVTTVVGCAEVGPREELHPHMRVDPKSAYVYGRFSIDTKESASLLGDETLTFEIRCRDGRIYPIRFDKGEPFQLVPIRPSICQIEDVVFDDSSNTEGGGGGGLRVPASAGLVGGILVGVVFALAQGDRRPREMASFRLLRNEIVEAGGVYYVGDFSAKATVQKPNGRNFWTATVRNEYASTTDELKRRLLNFAALRTENRM